MDALAIRSASATLPGKLSFPVHIQTTSSRCSRWLTHRPRRSCGLISE
jgi:hypothetical protein